MAYDPWGVFVYKSTLLKRFFDGPIVDSKGSCLSSGWLYWLPFRVCLGCVCVREWNVPLQF